MTKPLVPLSLKDAPSLIERLLPVQKLSAEAYKEQMANVGKTLTALGSYWKGRKPLILNKACILGCLLPATNEPSRDLAIFEKLMAMDDESFAIRWKRRPRPKDILAKVPIAQVTDYFTITPEGRLPSSAPIDWADQAFEGVQVSWRDDVSELRRRRLEAQSLPMGTFRAWVEEARRPEEVSTTVHDHIWTDVNAHLGTSASSFPALIEQLGIMRFGHRPRFADPFCGSGQIPFEAARLGCDVFASDLNPVACMLTWAAFNIVGGSVEANEDLAHRQEALIERVREQIDALGVETDGNGWRGRAYLYCVEARCPSTGWLVPLLPSRVVSVDDAAIVELIPDPKARRYDIRLRTGVTREELVAAHIGTVVRDGTYGKAFLAHSVNGTVHRMSIPTLRGDIEGPDGSVTNKLRQWDKCDVGPRADDLLQERLYAIQWCRPKPKRHGLDYEFRTVTTADFEREAIVRDYLSRHIEEWQRLGNVPDMRIEIGGPPRYQGLDLVRARGWTHWNHVFSPRQLLVNGLFNRETDPRIKVAIANLLQHNAKLSRWDSSGGGRAGIKNVFSDQALNTLYNYGARGSMYAAEMLSRDYKVFPLPENTRHSVESVAADCIDFHHDIGVSDPPYGDAVKYEEILDFFIAWLRKNPASEFSNWVWDSRRPIAIKGEGEEFRRGMVAAYRRMTDLMPENGIQVIMFTHQSGSIWADMANIVWASGLQVTAAWYVVTETDSPLREGSYVKGTVLLVCRKRSGSHKTTRDDLAWEIEEEVEKQVKDLAGLNQAAKGLHRDENVFADADVQMAGYAAALRVLTRYATIDGRNMATEASRPRVKGDSTFVDGLIEFAVSTANQCLVPPGIGKPHWDRLTPPERFYLKLLDLEEKGLKTLDNYQNFAKAFKVKDFRPLMANQRANDARLRSALEFGKLEMSEGSELHQSALRAVLFAMMELVNNIDSTQVLAHLTLNVPDYYSNQVQRELVVELADYLDKKLEALRPEEASAARVLREMVKNQRLG